MLFVERRKKIKTLFKKRKFTLLDLTTRLLHKGISSGSTHPVLACPFRSTRTDGQPAHTLAGRCKQTDPGGPTHPCPKFCPPMRRAGQRARPPLSSLWPTRYLLPVGRSQLLLCPNPCPPSPPPPPRSAVVYALGCRW
jgi:hypothetical protein